MQPVLFLIGHTLRAGANGL